MNIETVTECPHCKQRVMVMGSDEGTHYYANMDGNEHVCETPSRPTHCPRCQHYAIVAELEFGDDNYFCYGCNWRWRG